MNRWSFPLRSLKTSIYTYLHKHQYIKRPSININIQINHQRDKNCSCTSCTSYSSIPVSYQYISIYIYTHQYISNQYINHLRVHKLHFLFVTSSWVDALCCLQKSFVRLLGTPNEANLPQPPGALHRGETTSTCVGSLWSLQCSLTSRVAVAKHKCSSIKRLPSKCSQNTHHS